MNHKDAMLLACTTARPFIGAASPNPPVGAVALDSNGNLIAAAAHQKLGSHHAEAAVLQQCQNLGRMCDIHTLAVTLEPCNHHGRTPPCSQAIIAAGIKHVVVGTLDPNPLVSGGGIEALRGAEIDVSIGIAENACRRSMCAFLRSVTSGRPFIIVKVALDAHGSMIPPLGSKTFTSPASLKIAHRLRKRADAILTGSGTILADNPSFTVRHVADHPDKTRVLAIMDRRGRVSDQWLHLAKSRGFLPVVYDNINQAINNLNQLQVREILVEAGVAVTQAVLNSGLWDMLITVRQGNPDTIDIQFNNTLPQIFANEDFVLEEFLPQ